jgi:hypothetical protein
VVQRAEDSAGDVDGTVFVFVVFGGRVGGEPGLLVFDELGGFFAEIVDGFEGDFAGDAVGVVVGRGLQVRGPTLGGIEELGERLADVAVVRAVVAQVVVELVGDGGELLEEVVGVLFAARAAGVGEEILDGLVTLVEEFDKDHYAVVGDVGGGSELVDLGVGEDVIFLLSVERRSEGEECRQDKSEGKREATGHAVLVGEDLGEELVVDLIESFEGGLQGGTIFT